MGAITAAAVVILGMVVIFLPTFRSLFMIFLGDISILQYFFCYNFDADWNMGACLFGFQLLKSPIAALFIAGSSRVFLICFGVHYWFASAHVCFSYWCLFVICLFSS